MRRKFLRRVLGAVRRRVQQRPRFVAAAFAVFLVATTAIVIIGHFGGTGALAAGLLMLAMTVLGVKILPESFWRTIRRRIGFIEPVSSPDALMHRIEVSLAVLRLTQVATSQELARVNAGLRSISAKDSYDEIQHAINLFTSFPVKAPVPSMRGWAASPDLVTLLIREILRRKPRLVVECGSGVSTLWMAVAIKQAGLDTKVVSLDHLEGFANTTRQLLADHDVSHIASVVTAPLEDFDTVHGAKKWYARSAWSDLTDIDFIVVDGPPTDTGSLARYPTMALLASRLAPTVTVIMDDMIRASERQTVELWSDEFELLDRSDEQAEKHASVLKFARRR